jgi:hypothetical protein
VLYPAGHRFHTLWFGDLWLAIWARACSTTASGVNPNFVSSCFNGAEAPKVDMPITAPSEPT